VESGVSGLARIREWDATAMVELPELEDDARTELELTVRADGIERGAGLAASAVTRLLEELERSVRRPYTLRAVRQGPLEWLAAARELRSEAILLRCPGVSLQVAVPPEGDRSVLVDGEPALEPPDGPLAEAVLELERRGRERFEFFVARADRVQGERWELVIDPL
jgi:hypothetical protein